MVPRKIKERVAHLRSACVTVAAPTVTLPATTLVGNMQPPTDAADFPSKRKRYLTGPFLANGHADQEDGDDADDVDDPPSPVKKPDRLIARRSFSNTGANKDRCLKRSV